MFFIGQFLHPKCSWSLLVACFCHLNLDIQSYLIVLWGLVVSIYRQWCRMFSGFVLEAFLSLLHAELLDHRQTHENHYSKVNNYVEESKKNDRPADLVLHFGVIQVVIK